MYVISKNATSTLESSSSDSDDGRDDSAKKVSHLIRLYQLF